jgi:hypothetical protein
LYGLADDDQTALNCSLNCHVCILPSVYHAGTRLENAVVALRLTPALSKTAIS